MRAAARRQRWGRSPLLPAGPLVGRRGLLLAGAAGTGVALAGCGSEGRADPGPSAPALDLVAATDPEVAAAEARRSASGRTVEVGLVARAATVDLAGRAVDTWVYGDGLAAPEIRVGRGDRLRAVVRNELAESTTVHWHGIACRNDMDGAAPATQEAIAPGAEFTYDFIVPDPGTYWYHSHSGMQSDRAMLGPLVVEDPEDSSGADEEFVVVLDDWVDGLGTTPDAVLQALNPALTGGHGGHAGHAGHGAAAPATPSASEAATAAGLVAGDHGRSDALGGMTGHITYPLHLVNGRPPEDPAVLEAAPGARVRLRLVNAAAETAYRVAVAGHEMTVIAADGFDVEPVVTDALVIGSAQRYDVLVTARSGAWPVVAVVEGRSGHAAAVLRTRDATGSAGSLATVPDLPELSGRLVLESAMRPAARSVLEQREPDRSYSIDLIEVEGRYAWGMAGADAGNLVMREGERVRITMNNTTSMWHPMHTHGHTFAIPEYGGLRKDTALVLPGQSMSIDFDADNPGEWMFHCHNVYHFEAGMTANMRYVR
ncbi:multicopper oxidase family protein [Paenibacillus sp. TRM 82003]|uniref:multicopper oxidase family protein n=1 Tax=Kineococcus sp. TRM81007 TaxID=2925831 RepID=UPI001F5A308B|nr:multicopper oxidase family protein [Kineococcus sp. TRM81007]MCI2238658.1 multicopper oxidase family protein [Kineococcus sp. TRM81007]MCI3927320.1 multicopper oxidase family protein [Paenibacillus sp. TRM 82003]